MPLHQERLTDSPARPFDQDKALAKSYQKVAEALHEFSQQLEYRQRAGTLTDGLRDVAADMRDPVANTLKNLLRTVYPDKQFDFLLELRRYGVHI